MTQAKPPGEKYVSRSFTLPPDRARAIAAWHTGRLTRVIREAIARELAIDALPKSAVDRAEEEAVQAFWDRQRLEGQYAICNDRVIRHLATDEQMAADAVAFGVPVERLLLLLDELYDIERNAALRRAIALCRTA